MDMSAQNVAGAFKGTSDPFAVVTVLGNSRNAKPEVLGKTEVIKNTLDPNWTTSKYGAVRSTIFYELEQCLLARVRSDWNGTERIGSDRIMNSLSAISKCVLFFSKCSSLLSSVPLFVRYTYCTLHTAHYCTLKAFEVDYELGEPKNVLVKIFDEVRKGDNKSMGSAQFCVGSILGAKGNTKAKKLSNHGGTVFVRAQKAKDYGSLKLKMSGVKLANTDGKLFQF